MKGTKLILFLLVLLTPYFPTYGLSYSDPDITNCTSSAGVLKETYCTMISSSGRNSCSDISTQYCNQVPGCVLRSGVCQACPAGTADKTSDKTSSLDIQFKQQNETCKSCSFSSYSNYKFEIPGWVLPETQNAASYLCPYTVVCNDGKYYDFTDSTCKSCAPNKIMPTGQGSAIFIPNGKGDIEKTGECYTCGKNSSPNDTQTECTCNPYYQYNGSSSVTNCPDGICPPCTYKPTNITYTCTDDTETTYDDVATSEDYHINVNISNNCTKIGYTLAGWQCTTCNDTQTIYKAGEQFYNPAKEKAESFTGALKFTSRFEAKTFTITFKSSTSSDATNCFDPSSFNCTYDGDCINTNSQNIQVYLYKQGNCAAPANMPIFDGWECYKTNADGTTTQCSTDDNHITYDEIAGIIDVTTGMVKDGKDGDFKNIINLSGGDNAIFVPKFRKCTNGKYCLISGVEQLCPAPSTSDYDDNNYEPKNNISDCYITKDTKFCPNNQSDDSTECFTLQTLGEDTKIHHVEQDNGIVYE